MRKILCVTAHPDDEAASFGGSVAHYAGLGIHCRLVCLTAGEAARNRGGAPDAAALQAMRRQELAASCRLLGFHQHEVWDLPDAHLPEVPFYSTVGRLVAVIRTYRPDLVLTLGPEGSATAHPDHGMAGMLATAAFHWAAHERYFWRQLGDARSTSGRPRLGNEARPPSDQRERPKQEVASHPDSAVAAYQAARLYYSTVVAQPPQFERVWLPHPDVAMDVGPFLERKIQAFRCHTSQAPLFERVEPFLRLAGNRELFHLAAGAPLPDTGPIGDLFAGLPAL